MSEVDVVVVEAGAAGLARLSGEQAAAAIAGTA